MIAGYRIFMLRRENNISRAALSAFSGVSTSAIKQYETGKRQPQAEQLGKIASAFNVSTDYLLGRVDNPHHSIVPSGAIIDSRQLSPGDPEWHGPPPGYNMVHEALKKGILQDFETLNDEGKHEAGKRVNELTEIPKYQKEADDE